MELEHKDGNNANWSRENLEALCPNCHSQTPTWRGRNGNGKKGTADAEILAALDANDGSIARGLRALGLSPCGGNRKRALRLLELRALEKIAAS